MSRIFKIVAVAIGVLFVLPSLASVAVWQLQNRPQSWRSANWQSAGILPDAARSAPAAVYIMAARTGGLKGAFSVHSWIVTKRKGAAGYNRYDKVGWGSPVRVNAYPADGRWYSNHPEILYEAHGSEAEALIGKLEAAIADYPYRSRGGYRLWPGPNSNSFVAHVVNSVPELGIALPPHAVGRDYLSNGRWVLIDRDWRNLIVSADGLVGFSVGVRSGIELNLFGLVAGMDFVRPSLKLPGFGRIDFSSRANALGLNSQ